MQLLPFWIFFGALTAYLAHKRGRNPRYWFMIGLFMGLLGMITLFFLPVIKKEKPTIIIKPLVIKAKNPDFDKVWFYVDVQNQRQGPIYFADLWKAWHRGDFDSESLVWSEGMPQWQKVKEVPDFLKEFTG